MMREMTNMIAAESNGLIKFLESLPDYNNIIRKMYKNYELLINNEIQIFFFDNRLKLNY